MSSVSGGGGKKLFHARDEKALGAAGGSSVSDAWQTRVLNTVLTDGIPGASLASNQITLPPGTYDVEAHGPTRAPSYSKCAIYNVTDAAYLLEGTNGNAGASSIIMPVAGRFTLTAEKVIELRQYTYSAIASAGLGYQSANGTVEVYAEIRIWKV